MRVLVTRAEHDAEPLCAALRDAGFTPVHVPLVAFEPVAPVHGPADVLVLTSRVAAGLATVDAQLVAAVGASTTAVAGATVVPDRHTVAELARALGDLTGRVILYPRAERVSPGTLAALRSTGARVVEVIAYRNVAPPGFAERLAAVWPVDAVTLLSGSAARRLATAGVSIDVPVVAIGPSTARAAREAGLEVTAVADPHTVEGVVAALR